MVLLILGEMLLRIASDGMSENKVILDANVLVGFFDGDDIWHSRSESLMSEVKEEGVFLDCVLNELFTVLYRRAQNRGVKKNLTTLIDNINKQVWRKGIFWAYTTVPHYYEDIISLIKEHQGVLNFHDCLIAIVAREENMKKIVSFDKDFDKVSWLERIE